MALSAIDRLKLLRELTGIRTDLGALGTGAAAAVQKARMVKRRVEVMGLLGIGRAVEPAPVPEPTREYRYALLNRPVAYGAVPKGQYRMEDRPDPGQDHYEVARHGIIVYDRKLTDQEVTSYELVPLIDGAERDEVAKRVVAGWADDDVPGIIEMADEDPRFFVQAVDSELEALFGKIDPSVGNMDAFAERVMALLRARVSGRSTPDPAPLPPAVSPDDNPYIARLREVADGRLDNADLAETLDKIEAAVLALDKDGALTGDAEDVANAAITRWAENEERVNG